MCPCRRKELEYAMATRYGLGLRIAVGSLLGSLREGAPAERVEEPAAVGVAKSHRQGGFDIRGLPLFAVRGIVRLAVSAGPPSRRGACFTVILA